MPKHTRIPIRPDAKKRYDCGACPGYCCTYKLIPVTERDVQRLARHFGISDGAAEERFTRIVAGDIGMRHKKDHVYASTCIMFDREKRCCTVYESRPQVCREYPVGRRCGYYDFLKFERDMQADDAFIPDA
jgi:Fe-S-cluster containining protein